MTTVGTSLGPYVLGELLGSSGLATVYRAQDSRTGQPVALKVLHSYFSQERALAQRFFRELEWIKALDHPNVLPLLDWGEARGTLWLASAYAPEGSLRTTWQGPGPLETALLILEGVASGLEHALARGRTHRDLKPSNVFWDQERGTVRLGDFGMALLGEGAHPLVRTALSTPMPAFMAPEYAAEGRADPRTEAFSLAVLAYWLLTGVVPYVADSPATMYAKAMRHEAMPPSTVNRGVPPAVDRALLRALAPFAAVRPPGPMALVEALRAATAQEKARLLITPMPEEAVPSPPPPTSQPAVGPAPARPLWSDAAALERLWRAPGPRNLVQERVVHGVLALSFIAASLLGYVAWNKPPQIPQPATPLSAEVAPDRWALPRHDLLNSGYAPVPTGGIKGQVKWKFQTGAPFSASPTSDGRTVYAATGDNRVLALDAATGALRWEAPTTGPVDAAPVAAGDYVYVGLRDKRVLALDRATGALRWEFATENPVITAGAVAGGVLYQGSGDGKLYALDAATGALLWSFDAGSWIVAPPAVTDDVVIVAARNGWIHFLDRATGRQRFLFYTGGSLFTAPAVAGDRVHMATESRRLFTIDIRERSTFLDRQIYWLRVQLWIWQMAPQPSPPKGFVWVARLPARTATSAALAHGLLYVGSEANKLLALDATTGKVVWELGLPAPALGPPVVTQDVLYAGADDGRLYALAPSDGTQLWSFQTGGRIRTSPAIANGLLFVTSEDGALYALG